MPEQAGRQVYPEPIVGALVLDPEGRLLLVKSHKWGGKYGLPGGHVELGERLEQALKREVKEETGLDADQLSFLCYQEMVFDHQFWTRRHFIFFEFVCRAKSADVSLSSEAEEYLWVDPAQAQALDLDRYTRRALELFLRNRDG